MAVAVAMEVTYLTSYKCFGFEDTSVVITGTRLAKF